MYWTKNLDTSNILKCQQYIGWIRYIVTIRRMFLMYVWSIAIVCPSFVSSRISGTRLVSLLLQLKVLLYNSKEISNTSFIIGSFLSESKYVCSIVYCLKCFSAAVIQTFIHRFQKLGFTLDFTSHKTYIVDSRDLGPLEAWISRGGKADFVMLRCSTFN